MEKSTAAITKFTTLVLALLIVLLPLAFPAPARATSTFPAVISLPNGFNPEGLAIGRGTSFYAGSAATGAIYKGDLRTGAGGLLVPPQPGRVATGLAVDQRSNYLFAAGGPTGFVSIYDAETGAQPAAYQLTTQTPTFINDVLITRDAAYFTDSFQPVLYRLPLGPAGSLPAASQVETIPLSGDFQMVQGFNANGLESTSNGKYLITINSTLGTLYRIDPETGVATLIDLGGASLASGDGILLHGWTLYVVRNFLNEIDVVKLNPDLTSGSVVTTITNPEFRIPTSIDEFGHYIYVVNARFDVAPPGTPPDPNLEFQVVQVPRH